MSHDFIMPNHLAEKYGDRRSAISSPRYSFAVMRCCRRSALSSKPSTTSSAALDSSSSSPPSSVSSPLKAPVAVLAPSAGARGRRVRTWACSSLAAP